MKLPDLAGQVIVADWQGTDAPVRMVRDLHLGGVIAFSANVASAEQVRAVNRALTRQVPRTWPLFLGVDQEGGVVERLRGAATRFPTFMSTGAAGDAGLTQEAYAAGAAELRGLGFTVDFAPDADVTSGPGDPTIGSRSASSRPGVVAEHVVAAATGFSTAGVLPVIKHFPGHGSVPADSHLTLPVQGRTKAQLEASDLVPFARGIEAGLPAVMVGHLDVRAVDPRVPSSLSRKVVTGLLRDELGFAGLVVTDSLEMAAVTRGRDPGRTAVQALRAGSDVLLMPPSPAVARAALVRAVRGGTLPRRRLEQAAARQIALLTHLAASAQQPSSAPGAAAAASRRLSAAAVTVTDGACSGRLVGDAVHAYGDPSAVGAFTPAAQAAGITVLARRSPPADLTSAKPRPDRRKKERKRAYQRARARLGEGRGPPGAAPRRVAGRRGRATRGRHADRVHRLPGRPRRRPGRRGHRQPVGAGTRGGPDPDRHLRRHARRDAGAGRGADRSGAGTGPAAGRRPGRGTTRLLTARSRAPLRRGRRAGPSPARRPG